MYAKKIEIWSRLKNFKSKIGFLLKGMFKWTRVLIYTCMDSPEAVKGTCNQQRLRSDCTNVQADLSFVQADLSLQS